MFFVCFFIGRIQPIESDIFKFIGVYFVSGMDRLMQDNVMLNVYLLIFRNHHTTAALPEDCRYQGYWEKTFSGILINHLV